MATFKHPLTGVETEPLPIKRKALNRRRSCHGGDFASKGETYHDIAAMLGTNTHRLGEVYRGEVYPDAREIALGLMH